MQLYAFQFFLFFGLAMILYPTSVSLLQAEVAVMSFSGLGVTLKLAKKEKLQCVCLGTFLKVTLTKVTILKDFGMVVLAGHANYFYLSSIEIFFTLIA
jgi:hypothetical protein